MSEPTALELAVAAAATWPSVRVPSGAFADRLTALAAATERPLSSLHASDLYLAHACALGDAAAVAALDSQYLRALTPALRRLGLEASAIDETLQIVREELLVTAIGRSAGILDFSGAGHLAGWLRTVTTRTALRDRRRPHRSEELVDGMHSSPDDDLELAYMKKTYGAAFARAFAVAIDALPVEDRLLLKQRWGHRLGVVELGRLYGVNAGTISRRVAAVRERLFARTRDAMSSELRVGETELASILRLIESQLEVSLSALG